MKPTQIAFNAAVDALERLRRQHFTDAVKLSFVMHHPSNPDCYLVVTTDPDGLMSAVQRAKDEGAQGGSDV